VTWIHPRLFRLVRAVARPLRRPLRHSARDATRPSTAREARTVTGSAQRAPPPGSSRRATRRSRRPSLSGPVPRGAWPQGHDPEDRASRSFRTRRPARVDRSNSRSGNRPGRGWAWPDRCCERATARGRPRAGAHSHPAKDRRRAPRPAPRARRCQRRKLTPPSATARAGPELARRPSVRGVPSAAQRSACLKTAPAPRHAGGLRGSVGCASVDPPPMHTPTPIGTTGPQPGAA